jgi:hypothetical protein
VDKISKMFMEQVQNLQKQIADLLEKEPLRKQPEAPASSAFAVSTDLSQLEEIRIGLPVPLGARVETLFARLSPYFEAGILFQRQPSTQNHDGVHATVDQWLTSAGFEQGQFYALHGMDLQIPFHFPQLTLVEVQKVHSKNLFDQLQQIRVAKSTGSQVLIFKPHPDFIFLVSSELPDLWLKPHIEKIQKELLLILCDEVD